MTRFWDASALVPLITQQPKTQSMRSLLRQDERMVAWWTTRVECISALSRLIRDATISSQGEVESRALLEALAANWFEMEPTTQLRTEAERVLWTYPLRAADALQLAAALVWSGERSPRGQFVTLDHRLREAALQEGFDVQPVEA